MNKVSLVTRCLLGLVVLASVSMVALAQDELPSLPYTCATGESFENAIQMRILMRPGTYTATVLGIDGFDPQLAVVSDTNEELGCANDSADAADYAINLPTTGNVSASASTAQLKFRVRGQNFVEVYFFVSGTGNESGRFAILFETLSITRSDGTGDPFVILDNDSLSTSKTDFTVYMIALDDNLDPFIQAATRTNKPLNLVINGQLVECDDTNTPGCFGDPDVPEGDDAPTVVAGDSATFDLFDAMLTLNNEVIDKVKSRRGNLLLLMTSFNQESQGEYMVIIDAGIGEASGG